MVCSRTAHATRITFGGVTTNAVIPASYGSRLNAATAAAVEGSGWTPHVVLGWSGVNGTKWDFYNDAEWPGVAQTDTPGAVILPREWRIVFSADSGFGVKVSRFVIDDYADYAAGHSLTWELRQGAASGAILFSGNVAVAANANVPVNTGMSAVNAGTVVLIIRQTAGAGDDLAIDDLEFEEAMLPTVTWPPPDAILAGTPLGPTQLSATANVAGTFVYAPEAGAILPAGTHTLNVSFEPASAPGTSTPASVPLLVKSSPDPVITHASPLQLPVGAAVTITRLGLAADVNGAFTLTPPEGTKFNQPGTQNVAVQFTPANPVFNPAARDLAVQIVPEGTLWLFSNAANRYAPAYGPSTLAPYDPAASGWPALKISFDNASEFPISFPAGGDTVVMRFNGLSAGQSLRIAANEPPNGNFENSGWISNYTLIGDFYLPSPTASRLPLWNNNATNSNAAEAELTSATPPRLAIAGQLYESASAGAWHRVAAAVRSATAEGQAHLYLDGRFIGAYGSNDSVISGAYAIDDVLHLLADNTGGGSAFMAGLRFVPRMLDYSEIVALGQVHSAGPDTPGPAALPSPYAPRRRPFIMAHRGDCAFAPEDTLPAIVGAFDKGANACEVDIRLTSDGVAVLMHDATVDRTTDGTGNVTSFTAVQLQTLDAGSWFGPQFAGTRPPTLAQVLAAARGRGVIYLDIKVSGMLPAILQAINATGFNPDDLLWWTYDESTLTIAQIVAVYPNAKVMWEDGTARNSWAGWSAAQRQAWAQQMRTRGIWGFDYGSNFATISPAFIAGVHDAGFFVSVYSLLSPDSINRATETAGVDGFETDIPGIANEMFPALSLTLLAVPLGTQTVRLRWTDAAPPASPRYDVFRRTAGSGNFTWSLLSTLNAPALREYFDRSAAASTVYEYLVVRHDGTRPVATTNGVFATTPGAGSEFSASYAEWAADQSALTDPEADADNDGHSNFAEFAFATPPLAGNAPAFLSLSGTGRFTVRRRHAGGLTWQLQSSTDLRQWSTLTAGSDYTESVAPLSADEESAAYTLTTSAADPRRFYRVHTQVP
jgi:glycerophosphoryl diester phosphodiesterase